jgi:hypothetical protein
VILLSSNLKVSYIKIYVLLLTIFIISIFFPSVEAQFVLQDIYSNKWILAFNAPSYEGGIFLKGNEVAIIENKILHLKGDIIIKDNAQLIIRNSIIIWELTHFVSYVARVYDNGMVLIENSTLERGIPINANMWLHDNALVVLKNSRSTWDILPGRGKLDVINSSILGANGIFFFGQSKTYVRVFNSYIKWIVVKLAGKKEELKINGMKPGYIKNLVINTLEGSHLEINNSTIEGWVVDMDFYYDVNKFNEKHVILEDSIVCLWLWFRPESYVKLENWRIGNYKYWNLRENAILRNIEYDLTLINTTIVEFIKLQVLGKAEFNNLRFIQVSTWGNAEVFVNNSVISAGILLRGRNDSLKIYNSRVISGNIIIINGSRLADFGGDIHRLEFKNTTIENLDRIEVATAYSEVKGEVRLSEHIKKVLTWSYGNIKREYPIIVIDEKGTPIPGAIISLIDNSGRLINSVVSDDMGKAVLNITFNSKNYNEKWTIEVMKIPSINVSNINFFTSTPVIITLKENIITKTTTLYKTTKLVYTSISTKEKTVMNTIKEYYTQTLIKEVIRTKNEMNIVFILISSIVTFIIGIFLGIMLKRKSLKKG